MIASFWVQFTSLIKYRINFCNTWTDLPTQPPDEVDKIWTFNKTSTALIISCNGVEVLNYVFSDTSNDDCVPRWSRDVEKIQFAATSDTASDYYKQPPITGIK